jgi:succinoglycan biosynthesis transport protein ExoP
MTMNGNDTGARHFSVRDILAVVFRRKVPVTIVAVVVAATALTAASRTSSVYDATAKVFLRRSGATPLANSWTPFYGLEEEMNTEVEIVRSVDVMSRAVEILEEEGVYYETTVGDSVVRRDPTIGDISAGLSATPIEMSNVLLIKYTGSMPRFVEAAANAAAEAYVEHRIEVRSSTGIQGYFEDQLSMLEDRLLDLSSAELELRKESNIYDLEWQYQMTIGRKNEIEVELSKTTSERIAEEKKLQLYKQRLEKNPDLLVPFAYFEREKLGGQMLVEYWALRSERDEKAAVLTETNPEVKMLDKRIEEMEGRFREEVDRRLTEQEFLVEDLKAQEEGYRVSIAEIGDELRQTPDVVAQIKHLDREINYTYTHYEKLLEKMLDTMASEADDIRLSNAKIISPASVELTQVGRMQEVYVAFSILLGITLGVGFGFLLDNMDQSMRTAADVEDDLGVPLLGSVPDIRSLPELTRRVDRTFGRKA